LERQCHPNGSQRRQSAGDLSRPGHVPLLLAVSDNGQQRRSYGTREFVAAGHQARL